MSKAIVWLEEGFDATYQHALKMSRMYHGDIWRAGWDDTEYTELFRPIIYIDNRANNAFYSIKEDR